MSDSKSHADSSNRSALCTWMGVAAFTLSVFMTWSAFYELFIWEKGIHIPRVQLIESGENIPWARLLYGAELADVSLHYRLNVSTVGWFVILLSAFFSSLSSALVLAGWYRKQQTSWNRLMSLLTLLLLLTQLIAFIVIQDAAFTSAGDFG